MFASEQNRDDVKEKRQRRKRAPKSLAGSRVIFMDEFCANTKLVLVSDARSAAGVAMPMLP